MKGWGELAPVVGGMDGVQAEVDVPMSSLTSLRVGGPVDLLVRVRHEKALAGILSIFHRVGCPWFTLGAGTNLLVTDEGVEGAAVSLVGDFRQNRIEETEETPSVVGGAGAGLFKLLVNVKDAGLSGLEYLTGIPGTVGGAVIMNAGTLHGYLETALLEARLANPDGLEWVEAGALGLGYRKSEIPEGSVVVSARMRLQSGVGEEQKAVESDLLRRRKELQPPMQGTAGSFFKNPDIAAGLFAGRLIEECGMKGKHHGGAYSSTLHANFLTNGGSATATDMLELACILREEVKKRSGADLEPEVRIVGRNADRWWARLGVGSLARRTVTGKMESL